MATAVIVDAVRTPGGKRNGKLSGWHPADLAGETLKALAERNGLDPSLIDDVIMGCVMQVGHQGVIAGAYDLVIAAGVEGRSTTPMGASVTPGSMPFGPKMIERYAGVGGLVPQGISAELIADKWGLSREDLDAFGARSQQLAAQATDEGRFEREIIPVKGKLWDRDKNEVVDLDEIVSRDEGIRPGTTAETLANLKPAFKH